MERDTMPLLDCMVSYFGLDENENPGVRRYFCYLIFAGPGPSAGSGVAVIRTLAAHSDAERCDTCEQFHAVRSGGPRAALARAILYLDAYHHGDHLKKVQSDVRSGDNEHAARSAPVLRTSRGSGFVVQKG